MALTRIVPGQPLAPAVRMFVEMMRQAALPLPEREVLLYECWTGDTVEYEVSSEARTCPHCGWFYWFGTEVPTIWMCRRCWHSVTEGADG
jgi:hypothetical protein